MLLFHYLYIDCEVLIMINNSSAYVPALDRMLLPGHISIFKIPIMCLFSKTSLMVMCLWMGKVILSSKIVAVFNYT